MPTKTGKATASAKRRSPKSAAKTAAPPSAAPKKERRRQPIRRELWGVMSLLTALCVSVSYFTQDGWLIALLPKLGKGLFGFGYYLQAPALLWLAWVLFTHEGRPVRLRCGCVLCLPVIFGTMCHLLFCRLPVEWTPLRQLWSTGCELYSGGVISGGMALLFRQLLGKAASVIIFTVLTAILLLVILRITPAELWTRWKNRERLTYDRAEDEEEEPSPTPQKQERLQIDIPLDEPKGEEKPKKKLAGFFQPLAKGKLTPADLLEQEPQTEMRKQAEPAPMKPATEYPSSEERESRRSTAEQVEQEKEQLTAEIEQNLTADGTYEFPPIELLHQNTQEGYIEAGAELRVNTKRLNAALRSFGIEAASGDVVRGPAVTRYEFTLNQGVKLSKVTNLADDIALALGVSSVRIAPIPDKISVVGIEVPNRAISPVLIRDVIESSAFASHRSTVAFAVGRDIGNQNIVGDIARLPHVLIAGTTGSGKSVCTNSLIVSLLYKSSPEDVRFIMIDPKMVELAPYNGIPHLLIPVVTDPKKAAGALQWAVYEMMKRYKTFSELGVKKLEEYNAQAAQKEELPHMASVVVVIDELADLMLVAAKEVEESICRVAQMGRAAGVHLVIATQRPSSDVITGLMKANIPSRIAFAVASALESRIILDNSGAEKLVGRGDMLFAPLGNGKPQRVQGCYITPEEIEQVVAFVKASCGEAQYSDEVIRKIEESVQEKERHSGSSSGDSEAVMRDDSDELLPAVVDVILETGQASVSMLQRRLKLGYARAARLVDQMEERGIVGASEGSKPRQILITRERWQEHQMRSGKPAAFPENADDGQHVVPWEEQ